MICTIIVNCFIKVMISKDCEKKDNRLSCHINSRCAVRLQLFDIHGDIIDSLLGANMQFSILRCQSAYAFSFQAMPYDIDEYCQKGRIQTNIIYLGLYIFSQS